MYDYWYLMPGIPISIWLMIKLIRKFSAGRAGWDLFILKMPIFGQLIEKNIVARTTRTLGTLVTSGVPILEALHITKETSNNAVFEHLYQKVYESIREGDTIAQPMKEHSKPPFNPVAMFFLDVFYRRADRLAPLRHANEQGHYGRHGHQHGRRRRRDGRVGHDALQKWPTPTTRKWPS